MKKLILGAALALVATYAVAGSIAPPIIEDVVIIDQASSSMSHAFIPPALFLIAVASAIWLL